jgi:hypothetical protein
VAAPQHDHDDALRQSIAEHIHSVAACAYARFNVRIDEDVMVPVLVQASFEG